MTKNSKPENIWDVKQCAAALGWSEKTLRNRTASGTGPPYKKNGGRLEFLPSQIALWQKRNVVGFIHDTDLSMPSHGTTNVNKAVELATESLTQEMTPQTFRLLDQNQQDSIIEEVVERSVTQMVNLGYALPPLVKLSAFAELLHMQPATLRKYIRENSDNYPKPLEKSGRELSFKRDDVVNFLKIEGQVPFVENLTEISEPVEASLRAILREHQGK